MDFSDALQNLKAGFKMARTGWNGKGMWVEMQMPDQHSKMQQNYLFITTEDGRVPWQPGQRDMFANDWMSIT